VNGNGLVNSATSGVWAGIRIQNALTSPKLLSLSTANSNGNIGVSCDTSTSAPTPAPTSVLASDNSGGVEISAACGFTSCGTASATCGAQP